VRNSRHTRTLQALAFGFSDGMRDASAARGTSSARRAPPSARSSTVVP